MLTNISSTCLTATVRVFEFLNFDIDTFGNLTQKILPVSKNIWSQVTEFVERLMKHASNGEVLMFKKPLDARLHQLLTYIPELNMASLTELEFISNFQAIQVKR